MYEFVLVGIEQYLVGSGSELVLAAAGGDEAADADTTRRPAELGTTAALLRCAAA